MSEQVFGTEGEKLSNLKDIAVKILSDSNEAIFLEENGQFNGKFIHKIATFKNKNLSLLINNEIFVLSEDVEPSEAKLELRPSSLIELAWFDVETNDFHRVVFYQLNNQDQIGIRYEKNVPSYRREHWIDYGDVFGSEFKGYGDSLPQKSLDKLLSSVSDMKSDIVLMDKILKTYSENFGTMKKVERISGLLE